MIVYEKKCLACGKDFKNINESAKFCSRRCARGKRKKHRVSVWELYRGWKEPSKN